ncbi:MAG: hypothetical protein GWP59_09060 [Chlamydiales bacterium]|nr:hypothetical protein [Chlamydiales bacterium]NCF71835.1 hypothetical protein [Chlamydiales bacterium]
MLRALRKKASVNLRKYLPHFTICLFALVVVFFSYIQRQNDLTTLRVFIPTRAKVLHDIKEENKRLQYQVDLFYSPSNLLRMSLKPEFGDLDFPYQDEVLLVDRNKVSDEDHEST